MEIDRIARALAALDIHRDMGWVSFDLDPFVQALGLGSLGPDVGAFVGSPDSIVEEFVKEAGGSVLGSADYQCPGDYSSDEGDGRIRCWIIRQPSNFFLDLTAAVKKARRKRAKK